jgi:outer membrane protein OmpA-like peptidoglycan-associated protein
MPPARFAFAAAVILALPLGAQPTSPLDVWYACRHPKLAAYPKVAFLCERAVIPWGPTSQRRDQAAAWARTDTLPSASEVATVALDAIAQTSLSTALVQVKQAEESLNRLRAPILFRPDSVNIDREANGPLLARMAAEVADYQRRFPKDIVTIVGGADPSGNPANNARLAERRAVNLKQLLLEENGEIDRLRLVTRAAVPSNDQLFTRNDYMNQRVAGLLLPLALTNASAVEPSTAASLLPPTPLTSLAPAEVATAFANALTNRAVFQVKAYAYGQALRTFCPGQAAPAFPLTCAISARYSQTLDLRDAPTPDAWRTAIKADARSKLDTLLSRSAKMRVGELPPLYRLALAMRDSVRKGIPAVRALGDALDTDDGKALKLPPEIVALPAAVAAASDAFQLPSSDNVVLRDTILLYAARAVAVDLRSIPDVKRTFEQLGRLLTIGRMVDSMQHQQTVSDSATRGARIARDTETLLQLMEVVSPKSIPPELRQAVAAYDAARSAGNLRAMWIQLLQVADTSWISKADSLAPLLTLAIDLATAPDPAAFQASVERYILGARGTGYKYARGGGTTGDRSNGSVRVTINSYVGVAAASGGKGTAGGMQLTIPIGLEVGRGGLCNCGKGYVGVLVHPIDLGAFSSLQLNSAERPPATLGQALSPGISVVYAPFRHPFVMGAGSVYREEKGGRRRVDRVFVAVDIPLFP